VSVDDVVTPFVHRPSGRAPITPRRVWIVETGEPVPWLDAGARTLRCGLLAEALIERGHDVTWWNSTFRHLTKSYCFDAPRTLEPREGLTINLLHAPRGYRRNVSAARWRHQRAVAGELRQALAWADPPDVIVAGLPTLELSAVAVEYGQRADVPVVVDLVDPWPDVYLSALPRSARRLGRLLLGAEYRRLSAILRGATALTSVSRTYLGWAADHGAPQVPQRQRFFPLGYTGFAAGAGSPAVERPAGGGGIRGRFGIPSGTHLAVFSGTFGRSYDLHTVVDCAALLHRHGRTDIHFVLAGQGDQMPALRRRAASLPNVTMTGWLDQRALTELIQAATVGLCAYAPHALQALPYKPFEYMAAGLPQISSLQGELAELLRTHGVGRQYDAGSASSLAGAIVAIVDEPTVRERMSEAARQLFARRFDARAIYGEMASFVESIATSPARAAVRLAAARELA
jgi:glycosyltransferase involved in cell wall biosynthesis